jgi:hypothetical protein
VRDPHRAVLRRFLDTGTAPTLDWLRQAARELGNGESGCRNAVQVADRG